MDESGSWSVMDETGSWSSEERDLRHEINDLINDDMRRDTQNELLDVEVRETIMFSNDNNHNTDNGRTRHTQHWVNNNRSSYERQHVENDNDFLNNNFLNLNHNQRSLVSGYDRHLDSLLRASRRYGCGNAENRELERGLHHQNDHCTDMPQHGQRQQRKRKLADDEIFSLISSDGDSVGGMDGDSIDRQHEPQSMSTRLNNVPVHEPHSKLQPLAISKRYEPTPQHCIPTGKFGKSRDSMNNDTSDPYTHDDTNSMNDDTSDPYTHDDTNDSGSHDADSAGGGPMPRHDDKVSSFLYVISVVTVNVRIMSKERHAHRLAAEVFLRVTRFL